MNYKMAAISLLVIGIILAVGGIVVSVIGSVVPEWVGKTLAIIVGAFVTILGANSLSHREDDS